MDQFWSRISVRALVVLLVVCLLGVGTLLALVWQTGMVAETVPSKPEGLPASLPFSTTAGALPAATPSPTPGALYLPLVAKPAPFSDMVLIPAGPFQMGCRAGDDCTRNQQPVHTVDLDAYWIDRYEVSNAHYADCVAAGACLPPASDASVTRQFYYGRSEYADFPVAAVTWRQAAAYCEWAGKRLPTEAEWEKAARGDAGVPLYPWGDAAPDCTRLNYRGEAGFCLGDTSAVGSYPSGSSPYGVMDLAGNVWEWVADWYGEDYYQDYPPDGWPRNPTGPADGEYRSIRGGGWDMDWHSVRLSRRQWALPDDLDTSTGFRCAR